MRLILAGALLVLLLRAGGFRVAIKNGVVLALSPQMARALPAIERAHAACALPRGPVITSGSEGDHAPGSLHYVGQAVDLRTRDLTGSQTACLVASLRQMLGADYDVVDESRSASPHIHVEYDPFVR